MKGRAKATLLIAVYIILICTILVYLQPKQTEPTTTEVTVKIADQPAVQQMFSDLQEEIKQLRDEREMLLTENEYLLGYIRGYNIKFDEKYDFAGHQERYENTH